MKVEIWADTICPFCYIGKRRLESALEKFEHRDQVDVVWRGFQLDPDAPPSYGGTVDDLLMRRYGMSRAQAEGKHAELTRLAAQDGLDYRFDRTRPGNSLDAHRLVKLAGGQGAAGAMEERLLRAYFTDGETLSDRETLVRLAGEVGLDGGAARAMLESARFTDEVRADQRRAVELGFHGVPAVLIDDKVAVSGAQSAEVFLGALRRAWELAAEERIA